MAEKGFSIVIAEGHFSIVVISYQLVFSTSPALFLNKRNMKLTI